MFVLPKDYRPNISIYGHPALAAEAITLTDFRHGIMASIQPQRDVHFPVKGLFSFFAERKNQTYPSNKVLFQSADLPERTLTLDSVLDLSARLSTALRRQYSLSPGFVLALCSPNSIDYPVIFLAVWHAGGVVTPLNPASTSEEISKQLKNSNASIVVSHEFCLSTVVAAANDVGISKSNVLLCGQNVPSSNAGHDHKHWRQLLPGPGDALLPEVTIEDPVNTTALLPYSSGTSGNPKGCILTHHNMTSNVIQNLDGFGSFVSWQGGPRGTVSSIPDAPRYDHNTGNGGDVVLAVLPMFHIYGLMILILVPLYGGFRCVINDRGGRFDILQFCDDVEKFGVTLSYIVPPMALGLVKVTQNPKLRRKVAGIRMLTSAAAPLGRPVIEQLWEIGKLRLVQAFGMTEGSPGFLHVPYNQWWEGRGTVGIPNHGVEVRIAPLSTDGESELGKLDIAASDTEDAEGELLVRGPNVFKGYLNNPTATSAAFITMTSADGSRRQKWFRTGDIAHRSANTGYITITDRLKEMIKYKGFPVAPAELESLILSCREVVADVAVLGVYNEAEGTEVPRAYVVRQPAAKGTNRNDATDGKAITDLVAKRAAGYKKLRGGVEFVEAIPRSVSGKILRRVLKAEVAQREKAAQRAKL